MRKIILSIITIITIVTLRSSSGYSQNASDYLECQDIGNFKKYGCTCSTGAGVLVPVDHFSGDHNDVSCTVIYHSLTQRMGIDVEVTHHTDPNESLRWLLHEVDLSFRNYYGKPGKSYIVRKMDANTVILYGAGGWSYRWISGTKVINIEYADLDMTKPEPLEIVQAYLAKHPSTLPAITATIQGSAESVTQWIKDEMERRIWLCDKWFMQFQLRKVEENEVYQQAVKSMNIFLDYREKYYRIKSSDEKNLLAGYLNTNNGTGIKAKLKEYKDWWAVNKDKSINL